MENKTIVLPQVETVMIMDDLRDIENAILCSMLESFENFQKIKNKISPAHFTFATYRIIYEALLKIRIKLQTNDKNKLIFVVICMTERHFKIDEKRFREILNKEPSKNIDIDLAELEYFFKIKPKRTKDSMLSDFNFIDKEGTTTAFYSDNRIHNIYTADIFKLPQELQDTALNTIASLSNIKLDGDNTLSMGIDPQTNKPTQSFTIHRDISYIKSLNKK